MTILLSIGSALALIQGGAFTYGKALVNSSGVATCTNIKYYIDSTNMPSSVISYYTGTIKDALQAWVDKTKGNSSAKSRVSFTRVYSQADATIIYRLRAQSDRGITYFYLGSKEISPFDSNWNKCIVSVVDTLWNLGYNQAKHTICHETGHCLGLAHPVSIDAVRESVMWPYNAMFGGAKVDSKYLVITPSDSDNTNLKSIYK